MNAMRCSFFAIRSFASAYGINWCFFRIAFAEGVERKLTKRSIAACFGESTRLTEYRVMYYG
jgi:hypothetical protein